MEYILYGAIRSRVMRELTEDYITHRGDKILFYCDDNEPRYGVNYSVHTPEDIGRYPDAVIVIMCQSAAQVVKKLRQQGVENKIVIAPLPGYRFICDSYCPPADMSAKARKWALSHEDELMSLYECGDEVTAELLKSILDTKKEFFFLSADWTEKYGAYEDYFYGLLSAGGGRCHWWMEELGVEIRLRLGSKVSVHSSARFTHLSLMLTYCHSCIPW